MEWRWWTEDKILQLEDEGKRGYLFDVDLKYPEELHDLHNGYALGCENLCIKNDMLNTWQQEGRKEPKI